MEDHNLVERRDDNQDVHFQLLVKMIDQKVVGNLKLGTDLEVDNPKACIDFGVDNNPEQYGVDLGVSTVLKVENLELALQTETDYLRVSPQAITDYLEVAPQAVTDYLAPQVVTDYLAPQAVTEYLEVEDLEYYQTS